MRTLKGLYMNNPRCQPGAELQLTEFSYEGAEYENHMALSELVIDLFELK